MSNDTFRNIKSIEQVSELTVSGSAVIHDKFFVKDLVASNVVYAPNGKMLKDKVFEVEFTVEGAGANVVSPWKHPSLKVVASEVEVKSGDIGTETVSVGSTALGTDIFNAATPPARVSSIYSQSLGTSGSPSNISFVEDGDMHARLSAAPTSNSVVQIRVLYYED